MEERKAQVGKRLIGRDAPIVVQDTGVGSADARSQDAAGIPPPAERGLGHSRGVDQRAVFRQQLAQGAAPPPQAPRPGRRRAEKHEEGRAAKKGFG